jgi:hypothetical protein
MGAVTTTAIPPLSGGGDSEATHATHTGTIADSASQHPALTRDWLTRPARYPRPQPAQHRETRQKDVWVSVGGWSIMSLIEQYK